MLLAAQGETLFTEVKNLLLELSRMDIAEFALEYGEIRIFVRKNGNGAPKARPIVAPPPSQAVVPSNNRSISSPLTGIFYLTPSPTAPPFVQEGDVIQGGQVIGMVEAMKVFNEIRAEWPGRVVRIHARNGELVQVGQTLIELAPLS